MKVIALVSGGKDSTFNMLECVHFGHEIVALANLAPYSAVSTFTDGEDINNDMDSYMYQTVGYQVIHGIAQCMQLPLFIKHTHGLSKNQSLQYKPVAEDEVEDLYTLLSYICRRMPDVKAVSCGTILSNYQRTRVENVCQRLGLQSLTYLWQRQQPVLLHEMINNDIDAILVKVACMGLLPKHLGQSIKQLQSFLIDLELRHGCNSCGEGGEYETFTLDCPILYKAGRIVVDEYEIQGDSGDIAPVAYYTIKKIHVEARDKRIVLEPVDITVVDDENNMKKVDGPSCTIEQCVRDNIRTGCCTICLLGSNCHYCKGTRDCYAKKRIQVNSDTNAIVCPTLIDNFRCSGFIFIPTDDSKYMVHGDIETQTQYALNSMKASLISRGYSIEDVFYVNLYVNDMQTFSRINTIFKSFFASSMPPSRSCIALSMQSGQHVALDCIAFHNHNSSDSSVDFGPMTYDMVRQILHVQSISRWAPCNIGPYCQVNRIGNILFLAGQIGLVPATMSLVQQHSDVVQFPMDKDCIDNESDNEEKLGDNMTSILHLQLQQSLYNCESILAAMQSDLDHCIACIVYVEQICPHHDVLNSVVKHAKILQLSEKMPVLVVQVKSLPMNALVEIKLTATVKEEKISDLTDSDEDDKIMIPNNSEELQLVHHASDCNGHVVRSSMKNVGNIMSFTVIGSLSKTRHDVLQVEEHVLKAFVKAICTSVHSRLQKTQLIVLHVYYLHTVDIEVVKFQFHYWMNLLQDTGLLLFPASFLPVDSLLSFADSKTRIDKLTEKGRYLCDNGDQIPIIAVQVVCNNNK